MRSTRVTAAKDKKVRRSRRVCSGAEKNVEQGSDNKLQVPSKDQKLTIRKQTPLALANVQAFASESEQRRIQSVRDKLTAVAANGNPNSIEATIAVGQAVENGEEQFPIGSSTTERKMNKRKRQNLMPTPQSGRTATQQSPGSAGGETPRKRCCKSDLKRCLRIGDILENDRVDEGILRERNNGNKLLARFDGESFIDCDNGRKYNSLTSWVKDRMIELGVLSANSNISGWNYAVVKRTENGYEQTIAVRQLVEETKKKMQALHNGINLKIDAPSTTHNGNGNNAHFFRQNMPFAVNSSTFLRTSNSAIGLTASPVDKKALQERLQAMRQEMSLMEQQLYGDMN